MSKLTKRERTMLYILFCVVLVVGLFYFLIFPALTEYVEIKDVVSEKQMLQAQTMQLVGEAATAQENIAVLRQDIATKAKGYYKPMYHELLDRMVTGMELRHTLTPESLTILPQEPLELSPYIEVPRLAGTDQPLPPVPEALPTQAAAAVTDSAAPPAALVAPVEEKTATMLQNNLTITGSGLRANFIALLDEISKNKAMRVIDFSLSLPTEERAKAPEVAVYEYMATIEVFLYEPIF